MKIKNTILGFLFVITICSVAIVPVNTVDASIGSFFNLIELLRIKRSTLQNTSNEAPDDTFSQQAQERAERTVTGRRVNYYTTTRQVAPQQKLRDFTVNNQFGFHISLPEGFSKKSDTLTANDGEVYFENENTVVKIRALGNVCEGGIIALQNCLNKNSDAITDALEKQNPSGIILQKEVLKLRETDNTRFNESNVGKQFMLDAGDQRILVLTFFDPLMKHLWAMQITAPDNYSGILNQGGVLTQIKESLFVKNETANKEVRVSPRVTVAKSDNRLMSQTLGRKNNDVSIISSDDEFHYEAQKLAFQISVPDNFHIDTDTLMHGAGELKFVNSEGLISITPMPDVCASQSASNVRSCVEDYAISVIDNLKKQNPQKTSLGINNYQLRLTTDLSDISVARGVTLMRGMERVAVFVFVEPEYGHVWIMNVVSNKGQLGMLGDVRKMKNLLGSMRFMK